MSHEVRKSLGTLREMLQDRKVDASSLDALSGDDLVALSGARNVFHVDLPSCGYRIIWDMHPKFKLADVRKLLEEDAASLGPSPVYVVIAREKPTHAALKGVADIGKDVQFFELRELQYNISRHVLVPPHIPVRDEAEIEEIVRRYRLKSRTQLPLILSSDPMARYLALKPDQVVRIIRPSPSAGSHVFYRCCTKAL